MPQTELENIVEWFKTNLRGFSVYNNNKKTETLVESFRVCKTGNVETVISTLCDEAGWLPDVKWAANFSRLCKKILPRLGPYDVQGHRLDIQHIRETNRFTFCLRKPVSRSIIKVDPFYEVLEGMVRARPATKQAVLIQHSGMTTAKLRKLLLEKGVSVELFVQHPDACCNRTQRGKVRAVAEDIKNYHKEDGLKSHAKTSVYYYLAPASLRAVLIDDDLLAIGWYTYHQEKHAVTRDEGIDIQGDSRPMVIVSKESPEFTTLFEMFNFVLEDIRTYKLQISAPVDLKDATIEPRHS